MFAGRAGVFRPLPIQLSILEQVQQMCVTLEFGCTSYGCRELLSLAEKGNTTKSSATSVYTHTHTRTHTHTHTSTPSNTHTQTHTQVQKWFISWFVAPHKRKRVGHPMWVCPLCVSIQLPGLQYH